MKKIILSLIIIFIISIGGYLFCYFKINNAQKDNLEFTSIENLIQKEYSKTIHAKDLDPKSFITLLAEKYKEDSPLNFVTMIGDFPNDWVKPKDLQYLISIMYSKEKCCGYMSFFSSTISDENAEIGGFAIIFLNSYISHTKINLGLNSNPKTNEETTKKIEKWYNNNQNLQTK
ncbi:hypothetical protein ACEN2I_00250 [Flavobacterium sp. W22_SRS_FK3]|uniref:hypothetical protein n=1 Tax=Flavobacterium sp. W22_SRS_FK3 TaxID=3240275 RepID=UPI003F908AC2